MLLSKTFNQPSEGYVSFYCPACDLPHTVPITLGMPHAWTWNGDSIKPTLRPSLLSRVTAYEHKDERFKDGDKILCHCWVTDGKIEYLGDSTHAYANQTIDIPDYPYI